MRYVFESNHRHAKFSARLLTKSRNSESLCASVVEVNTNWFLSFRFYLFSLQKIADSLADVDSDKLAAHVAVLVEFARHIPETFERRNEDIMKFLVKNVLMKELPPDPVCFILHIIVEYLMSLRTPWPATMSGLKMKT